MVSACPLISKSSSLFTNPLGIAPSASITIGITATFMFHYFLVLWQGLGTYVSGLPGLWSLPYGCFFFFFCWLTQYLVIWPRLGDPFVSQNSRVICASYSPGGIMGCAYTTCLNVQISISCTIPSKSPPPPNRVWCYSLFALICCIC